MQLKDRFPDKVKQYWIGFYTCLGKNFETGEECKKNHRNCLHHIIASQSSYDYIKGKHNESILNSCPLNNEECHLYKPLHSFKKQKYFLLKVKSILDQRGYKYEAIDYQFMQKYSKYYD
jgi:hypothetical protein